MKNLHSNEAPRIVKQEPVPGGHQHCCDYNEPRRCVRLAQFKAYADIPEKVPDAVGQVKKEGKTPAEQQQLADDRSHEAGYRLISARTDCDGREPQHERDQTHRQGHTRHPVQD